MKISDISVDTAQPPLVLDIDGTLTRPDGGLDGRLGPVLRSWSAPIVFATGKAFPYPVALCHYLSVPTRVVGETGGVVCLEDRLEIADTADRIDAVAAALSDAGHDLGWGPVDLVNRWRETELAVATETIERSRLADLAAEHDLEVVDSGYAYHVKDPALSKGDGVATAAAAIGFDLDRTVAIGDSENDVSTFERVGYAVALANADRRAKGTADVVVETGYADGTLEVLASIAPNGTNSPL